jgi:hypothetical protein
MREQDEEEVDEAGIRPPPTAAKINTKNGISTPLSPHRIIPHSILLDTVIAYCE